MESLMNDFSEDMNKQDNASYRNSTPELGRMTFHECDRSHSHDEYISSWHGKLVIVWQLLVTTPDLTQPT